MCIMYNHQQHIDNLNIRTPHFFSPIIGGGMAESNSWPFGSLWVQTRRNIPGYITLHKLAPSAGFKPTIHRP